MLYLLLLPFYIGANIYFFYEAYSWINALAKLAKTDHKRKEIKIIKTVFTVLYSICALALLLAFAIPDSLAKSSDFWWNFRRLLKLIGNYHQGVLMYLGIGIVAVVLGRGIRALYLKLRKRPGHDLPVRHATLGFCFLVAIITITVLGVVNARILHVKNYELSVNKSGGAFKDLRVVLVSDLHLGYNIAEAEMQQMVNKINAEKPDLVLIAGDIFDNEYVALSNPKALAEILGSIKSTYGVYTCYGNHDIEESILGGFTFGGGHNKDSSEEMDAFLEASGITLLRDEYVLIADSVYIYGRPDYQRPGDGLTGRKSAAELVADLDQSKPIIVLDHQPRELEELADAGVDIDLCGHTHDGQLFPTNLLLHLIWENSYGYLNKSGMHNIVTSGVGLFGPNMRVGTKAEICVIDISFN